MKMLAFISSVLFYLPSTITLLIPTATINVIEKPSSTFTTSTSTTSTTCQPTLFKPLFRSRNSKSFRGFQRRLERRGYGWIVDQMVIP